MATEKRLIDAYAFGIFLMGRMGFNPANAEMVSQWMDEFIKKNTVDAVSRGVHDQVRWERDVAIQQLEEHGIPFGGIAPDVVKVVRCKDCKHRGEEGCCPMYFVDEIEWDDDGYIEVDYVPHDYTVDDGFCDRGERRTNERKAD